MAGAPTTTDTAKKSCGRHSRKPAVGVCASCGSSMCRDCLVPTSVGMKCTTCTGRPKGARSSGGRNTPSRIRPVTVGLVVVALLAVGLAVNLLGGGDDGDDDDDTAASGVLDDGPQDRAIQLAGAGGVDLSATLALPENATPDAGLAGVVILAGFGPTNRDGLAPAGGIPDTLYRDVSDLLVDEGMVTLRYDKRGTGRSVLAEGEPLRFDDMVADAATAVAFLADRVEVDPERIAVVGHGEGGLVAMALAAENPLVQGVALISVPGRPLIEVIADDFVASEHGEDVVQLRAVVDDLLDDGRLPATIPPPVAGFFPVANEEYLVDIFSADPVALAGDVEVPVLYLRGESATFVTAEDEEALTGAFGSGAEFFADPDAGHTLVIEEEPAGPGTGGPGSGGHEHDAIGTAPSSERSDASLTRLTTFLATTTAA